jgi:glycosyltransferase involved in cell wall biosynthesis
LSEKVKESFLKKIRCKVIQNGIDLETFYPKKTRDTIDKLYNVKGKFIILGVASTWEKRKGLEEFVKLNNIINQDDFVIILIGLSREQQNEIPKNIIGISRTENVSQLTDLYCAADVFLNPTFEDTFPTTNLESLACGTPVITYRTGGSVESVTEKTGIVVEKGDVLGLTNAIDSIRAKGKEFYAENCRNSAEINFDRKIKFNDYLKIYKDILNNK